MESDLFKHLSVLELQISQNVKNVELMCQSLITRNTNFDNDLSEKPCPRLLNTNASFYSLYSMCGVSLRSQN